MESVFPSHSAARRPMSTRAPIQRFTWTDHPPQRGIYRYRITPATGVPERIRLFNALQVETNPVDVAVTQQGSITALFNRVPSGAAAVAPVGEDKDVLRDFLGGEVRRTLPRAVARGAR